MEIRSSLLQVGVVVLGVALLATAAAAVNPSYSKQVPLDTLPFYPGGTYDRAISDPEAFFGSPIGGYPIRYHELVGYLERLAAESPRIEHRTHGETHEGRALHHLIISSEANIAALDQIREGIQEVAQSSSPGALEEYLAGVPNAPTIAWMGYTIHGDELSGTDAAVQLAYQLAAGTDEATRHILDNVVVIIDPLQNPDGRERYLGMLQANQSAVPNYDQGAMQHGGVWPYGRTNHYLFDMNRDWIITSQPETRGRLEVIRDWPPQLMVDGHGMGANATFMTDPPREPINYNTPANVNKWWDVFNRDLATAFDERGWPHYTKEWHEQWYPGYGSAWGTFSGVIGILYEQARVDGAVILQRDKYLLSFHEAVNHQFRSSWSNLTTLASNREEILRDWVQARHDLIRGSQRSGVTYLLPKDRDERRFYRLIESLRRQGIGVETSKADGLKVASAVSMMGERVKNLKLDGVVYIVHTDQKHGALAKAILEFDPHLKLEFLQEERRELEKYGGTRLYEVSSWSAPLAYGLECYETRNFDVHFAGMWDLPTKVAVHNPEAQFGFIVDGGTEAANLLLVGLFGEGITVYAATKPFTIEDRQFERGSLVVRRRGNPDNLVELLTRLSKEVGVDVYGTNTAVATEGSYLGAGTHRALVEPRIALIAGEGMDYTSVGSAWYVLDKQLGIPHSLINVGAFLRRDMDRYNVIVLPSVWGGSMEPLIGESGIRKLKQWVHSGGTLICSARSASWAADTATGLTQVRLVRQSLDQLDKYDKRLAREMAAEAPVVDTMALWHPGEATKGGDKDSDESKPVKITDEDDRWARRFHPRGVFMRALIDQEDWLSFGVGEELPVMLYSRHAFLSAAPVRTTARLTPEEDKLRLSGLLWPEARTRWAGTAYATHERVGKGQVILFAGDPTSRDYYWGVRKMWVNAVLYGPSMGASWSEY